MKIIFLSIAIVIAFINLKAQSISGFHVLKSFHIASGGGWDFIAVGPDNNRLYVSHSTQVNILNETTGDSVGVIENTTGVHGIGFDKDENKGFASNGKINTLTVFDLTSNKILNQIATGEGPDAILYESFSKKIISCNAHGKSLSVIDPVKDSVIATISLDGNPEVAVSDDAGKLYVNLEDKSEIAVINTKTFVVEAHWPLAPGQAPTGLAIDKYNNRLFSGCSDNKLLVIMDALNGKVIDTLPIGDHCDGVAFDPTTKNIFASNGDGTLTVLYEKSANDFKLVQNVPTKKGARTLALDEKSHLIYLPTADFEKALPSDNNNPKPRPKMIPGTFEVLVVGK